MRASASCLSDDNVSGLRAGYVVGAGLVHDPPPEHEDLKGRVWLISPDLRTIDLIFDEMNVRDHGAPWTDAPATDPGGDKTRILDRQILVLLGERRVPLSEIRLLR